ncbi:probable inactive dual specificity protein phosphatase-like At4g18593 [Neltuma alba]|uniref:probable inactive dual specificity protein phosphatase-like At4g18593 n=1 Tax=Neltuma alba TaxID=207710 RepID=UPI0010A2D7E2|nr:probable inactive dual specificity protein phosphatase-like At4g18593 [Prosopis alba]XP_028754277.1 probable inactive dual specificity protein phosphatase-like At4g18593 [Prosopis alba]
MAQSEVGFGGWKSAACCVVSSAPPTALPKSYLNLAGTVSSESKTTLKAHLIYRRKKCRRIVASDDNIVSHKHGKGEASFKWKKRNENTEKQPVDCTSVFVEPMKWMQTVNEGHVEEKLFCLGCNARLGYFKWAGMQCSCGAWVNPAFQLHKCRLDECYVRLNHFSASP